MSYSWWGLKVVLYPAISASFVKVGTSTLSTARSKSGEGMFAILVAVFTCLSVNPTSWAKSYLLGWLFSVFKAFSLPISRKHVLHSHIRFSWFASTLHASVGAL
jgi:hypothetical protein